MSVRRSTNRNGARCGNSFFSCSISRTRSACPLSPMRVTFRLLCQVRQCMNLADPLADGPERRAAIVLAAFIGNSGLRGGAGGDAGAVADLDVVGEADLRSDYDEIAQFAASSDAGLRHDDVVAADMGVVADLDEVIEFGSLADHGVAQRASVDRRAGANFATVLDDDAAKLRDLQMSRRVGGEAEAGLADLGAGQDQHLVADEGVG